MFLYSETLQVLERSKRHDHSPLRPRVWVQTQVSSVTQSPRDLIESQSLEKISRDGWVGDRVDDLIL